MTLIAAQHLDPVAVYGAITATAALLWGISWSVYTWRRQFRTRVEVSLVQELTRNLDGSVAITGLVARVINHSTHDVSLDRVLLVHNRDKLVLDWKRSARGVVMSPRSNQEFHFAMADTIRDQVVRASIWLATGKNIRSKPLDLADPMLLEF